MMTVRLVFLVVALLAVSGQLDVARATTAAAEVRPQWLTHFSRDVYAQDMIASADGPNWTRLGNGEVVMFTVMATSYDSKALLARRFGPDGELLLTRVLPPSVTGTGIYARTIVANDPVSGDIVMLSGPGGGFLSPQRCRLLRMDSAFAVKSSTPLGSESPYGKACVAMQLLPDGSVIALDQDGLSRIDRNGKVLWSVRNGDDGRLLRAGDMLVDSGEVIWVASQGPLIGQQGAALLRFDTQGVRLSEDFYLCPHCVASKANALDLLGDGSVLVAGRSGSGQPGFLARYSSNGERVWVIDLDPDTGYERLGHDASGAAYALTRSEFTAADEVRRISLVDGSVLWTAPATDLVATNDGIVVTRGDYPNIAAVSLNASGAQQWSRVLLGEQGGWVSRAQFQNGNTEFLVKSNMPQTDCGNAPQVIAFDAAGGVAGSQTVSCLMPYSTFLRVVDANVGTGVLATLDNRIAAFTPEGDLRWEAYTCSWCVDHVWWDAKLSADGGAWAIDRVGASGPYRVNRLDAAGQVVLSLPFEFLDGPYDSYAFFGTDDQAIVIQAGNETLKWQRVSLGTMLETQVHTLALHPFLIQSARNLSDGGISVALETAPCIIMCPPPPPPNYSIARLSADGELDWSVSFASGRAALDDEGGAYAVVSDEEGLWHLRRVAANGSIATDIALPEITGTLIGAYGPIADRVLIVTYLYPDTTKLHLLDEGGNTLATRNMQDGMRVIDDSPLGLLVSESPNRSPSLEWIDPVSLETRATFRFSDEDVVDGSVFTHVDTWRLLSDGTLYGTDTRRNGWGLLEPRLARFSAPGYAPTQLIFRNGFD